MRLLILGGTGMVGFQMVKDCLKREKDFYVLIRNIDKLPHSVRNRLKDRIIVIEDVAKWDVLYKVLSDIKPDYVINCIGIVKQSKLASNYIKSLEINSLLPHKLEDYGSNLNYKLIHISTDCVFKGDKGNYKENDTSDAVDLYGKTKSLGEVHYGNGITLRTSIIGHELSSVNHHGLVEWFLSSNKKVEGYTKAIFSGLTTNELTRIILDEVIKKKLKPGLYNIASDPISKYDLLKIIAETYKKQIYIEPSDRIKVNRSLNGDKFTKITGYKAPTWEQMILDMKDC